MRIRQKEKSVRGAPCIDDRTFLMHINDRRGGIEKKFEEAIQYILYGAVRLVSLICLDSA